MTTPLDIVMSCLDIVPVPGLHTAFTILRYIWDTSQAAGDLKIQLETLTSVVAELLSTLNAEAAAGRIQLDSGKGTMGKGQRELFNLHRLLNEIEDFVKLQASYGLLKQLYKQKDSVLAIDLFYRRLSNLVNAFEISSLLNNQDWQKKSEDARARDQKALDIRLSSLESNQNQLVELLNGQHSSVMAMMISLHKSLEKYTVADPRQRKFLSHSLNYLASTSREQVHIDSWTVTAFEVEFSAEIGSGGFGQVFRGIWNKTPVALKVLKADAGGIPSSTIVRREIEAWSNLRHPHVLQFLGANIFDDQPFIVMPYLRNGNARDYVSKHPKCDRIKILYHISLGLVHLHSQNVIHGDLKALNVLIDDAGNAVLCDFGLSRVKADATSRSIAPGGKRESVTGSRNWMSPERLLGGALRKPVDIYAFGMTIYEVFTTEVPLGHVDYIDFINLVVDKDVRPERPEEDEAPALTDEIWDIAEHCWVKNPKQRPNAVAVCDLMERCIQLMESKDTPDDDDFYSPKQPWANWIVNTDSPLSPQSGETAVELSPSSISTPTSKLQDMPTPPPDQPPSTSQDTPQDTQPSPDQALSQPTEEPPPPVLPTQPAVVSPPIKPPSPLGGDAEERKEPVIKEPGAPKMRVRDLIEKLKTTTPDKIPISTSPSSTPGTNKEKGESTITTNSDGTTTSPGNNKSKKPLYKAKARYKYTASVNDPDELSFISGEILDILDDRFKWWLARKLDGAEGHVPSNYFSVLTETKNDTEVKNGTTAKSETSNETGFTSKASSATVVVQQPEAKKPVCWARVLYNYTPTDDPKELTLKKGEILEILDKTANWWIARQTDGTEGEAPRNYLTVIDEPKKQARALFKYTASADDPTELSFAKGEILDILDSRNRWWIARKADNTEGIIPSNYMQWI